jgi:hypothetical protein
VLCSVELRNGVVVFGRRGSRVYRAVGDIARRSFGISWCWNEGNSSSRFIRGGALLERSFDAERTT